MQVKELIELLKGLPEDQQEFNIVMAPSDDSEEVWSLDQISVAIQRNSHPPRGFVLFESLEVEDVSVTESEDAVAGNGSVLGASLGEVSDREYEVDGFLQGPATVMN